MSYISRSIVFEVFNAVALSKALKDKKNGHYTLRNAILVGGVARGVSMLKGSKKGFALSRKLSKIDGLANLVVAAYVGYSYFDSTTYRHMNKYLTESLDKIRSTKGYNEKNGLIENAIDMWNANMK